ncbi:MFS transporter [Paenarthrobacter nicotinovorans]|uniref:MFS transporter n=1 Tax=Paenarthrobacter nicotinovorans TaxID=29320 RepID=UPI0037491AF0
MSIHEPTTAELEDAVPHVLAPAEPGTSEQFTGGRPLRRYLTTFAFSTAAIVLVYGSVGIIVPNQVQLLEFGNFFTGSDAGISLPQLTDLRTAIAEGTATATSEQQRQLGLLRDFETARANGAAFITMITAIVALVIGPLLGTLSDRTRTRYGRRTPYILFGGLIGAVAVGSMQFAPNLAVLAVLAGAMSLFVGMAQGAQTATIADRVAPQKRGTASAIAGLGSFIGGIFGTVVGAVALGFVGMGAYYVPSVLVILGSLSFVLLVKDRSSHDLVPTSSGFSGMLRGFLEPLRSRDFLWVWIARIVMTFGYGVSVAFGIYGLQSYVQPALSQAEATSLSPVFMLIGLPGTAVALIVAGRWSDKIGRRKPFVVFASLLMALSFAAPLISPTIPSLFIQAVISGVAYGAYLSVDQALFMDVLPNLKNAGRDLGIAGLATNLGNALAPMVAAQIFALTGNYAWLWGTAAFLVVLSTFAILPVKHAR